MLTPGQAQRSGWLWNCNSVAFHDSIVLRHRNRAPGSGLEMAQRHFVFEIAHLQAVSYNIRVILIKGKANLIKKSTRIHRQEDFRVFLLLHVLSIVYFLLAMGGNSGPTFIRLNASAKINKAALRHFLYNQFVPIMLLIWILACTSIRHSRH